MKNKTPAEETLIKIIQRMGLSKKEPSDAQLSRVNKLLKKIHKILGINIEIEKEKKKKK